MTDERLTAESELIRMWMDDGDMPLAQAGAEIRKYGDLRAAEALEVLEHLIDIPQGCMCPNNGGGDCDWCQVVDHARLLIPRNSHDLPKL